VDPDDRVTLGLKMEAVLEDLVRGVYWSYPWTRRIKCEPPLGAVAGEGE